VRAMKITTWNINSVRLRLPLVLEVLKKLDSDILCLQETKTRDEFFPKQAFTEAGYRYIHINGMKSYNGMAIISRVPFEAPEIHARTNKADCRHIGAQFEDFKLHNLYIPAGGYEPDPLTNDKFQHKLDFVDELTQWFPERYHADTPVIAVGDFNIAPFAQDVWSHKQMLKTVSHTPAETSRLLAMRDALGWIDTARRFVPMEEKLYTWWSYRARDWAKSDRGRRLDHIWVTKPLENTLKSHHVLRDARGYERPSDHVPVTVELAL
jgi:exodeoxyribonuclease-3